MKKLLSSAFVLAMALSMVSVVPVSAQTDRGSSSHSKYNQNRDRRDNHRKPWNENRNRNERRHNDRNSWGWDNFRHGHSQTITASGNINYEAGDLNRQANFSIKSNRGRNDRGTGYFNYRDANGDWYRVDVRYVTGSGREVYFAGPVINASDPTWTGYWLYAKVEDSRFGGQIWGSFTDREDAISNFDRRNIDDPDDGPFRAFGRIDVRVSR